MAEYTGFPEMLDGRVKTLHPKIHGGILARHDRPDDLAALAAHGILTFELVVVNLYPFEATVARAGRDVRRGDRADRHRRPEPDPRRGQEPRLHHRRHRSGAVSRDSRASHGRTARTTLELRRHLAQAAFARTGRYDQAIADYLAGQIEPESLSAVAGTVDLRRKEILRYGENPHQQAALYAQAARSPGRTWWPPSN